MPIMNVNITGREARNYVNQAIDKYVFENYQPIIDLTDEEISTFVTNLELFLQTTIGTPNGYAVDVTLIGIEGENVVDTEVITRQISGISLQISVV